MKMLKRRLSRHLDAANAPFQFAPEAGTHFFAPFGFSEREFHSTLGEGFRLKRAMKGAWLVELLTRLQPARKREEMLRMGGIVLLARAES